MAFARFVLRSTRLLQHFRKALRPYLAGEIVLGNWLTQNQSSRIRSTMSTPTVTFVVPSYRLGHFLAECVNSVLSQTYSDWEMLIMDDCSPDNTGEVASSFRDPRVKYIRNEHNLGLVKNFNKGIGSSRGKYVWIISADDYLRRPYTLERYVELMEKHEKVGSALVPLQKWRMGRKRKYSLPMEEIALLGDTHFLKLLLEATSFWRHQPLCDANAMKRWEFFRTHRYRQAKSLTSLGLRTGTCGAFLR